jgi:methyl-accepting chemotaxis protein
MRIASTITGKLQFGFAAIAISACLSLAGFAFWQTQQRAHQEVARDLEAGKAALENALADEGRRQTSIARGLAVLPAVQAAAAAADRSAMLAALAPSFAALSRGGDITSLTVVMPSGVALARAHAPDAFGDDVSARRRDMMTALREARELSGVEQLPAGAAVTSVVPIMKDGRVIAVLNAGTVFNAGQLNRIRATTGLDLAIHAPRTDQVSTLGASDGFQRIATDSELRDALRGTPQDRAADLAGRAVYMRLLRLATSTGEPIAVAEIQLDRSGNVAATKRETL